MQQGYNEIDPRMVQNAHVLGQQRMLTIAEQEQAEQNALTIATFSIAGGALASMIEYTEHKPQFNVLATQAIDIAKAVLKKSEETSEDYGEEVGKRKLRNQLAAQIIYSALRVSPVKTLNVKDLITQAFGAASQVLEGSEQYAIEACKKEETSSTIELPS